MRTSAIGTVIGGVLSPVFAAGCTVGNPPPPVRPTVIQAPTVLPRAAFDTPTPVAVAPLTDGPSPTFMCRPLDPNDSQTRSQLTFWGSPGYTAGPICQADGPITTLDTCLADGTSMIPGTPGCSPPLWVCRSDPDSGLDTALVCKPYRWYKPGE